MTRRVMPFVAGLVVAFATAAVARIVSGVRHQYLIAFESAPEPGWRLLEIRTTQPGLTVSARSGGPGL